MRHSAYVLKKRLIQCMLWGTCVAATSLCAVPAVAVTYEVGMPVSLLPPDFYAGTFSYTHPLVPSISVPAAAAGRLASFPVANPIGDLVAFRMFNLTTSKVAIMVVEVDTGLVYPLTVEAAPDGSENGINALGPLSTSPDGISVYANTKRINGLTGVINTHFEEGLLVAFDITVSPSVAGRYGVAVIADTTFRHLGVAFINTDGSIDDTPPDGLIATGFPDGIFLGTPRLSPDGDKCVFQVIISDTESDIYVLEGILDILASGQSVDGIFDTAVTDPLTDPRIIDLRASDTTDFATAAFFDFSGELVIFTEDVASNFDLSDVLGTLGPPTNFDTFVTNADGSSTTDGGGVLNGDARQLETVVSDSLTGGTLDGRVLIQAAVGGKLEIFIAPVTTSESIVAVTGGDISDLAGTHITVPPDALALDGDLSVSTPTDLDFLEGAADLNDDPIIGFREFGPPDAAFDVPVTIEIPFTEDQLLALDPGETLDIVVVDPITGEPIVGFDVFNVDFDLGNMVISFDVDGFDVSGAVRGGSPTPLTIAVTRGLPAGPPEVVYVDFAEPDGGDGAVGTPLNTLGEALAVVDVGGVIRINGNSGDVTSDETFSTGSAINQDVTIEANPAGASGVGIGSAGGRSAGKPASEGFTSRGHILRRP